MEQDKGPVIIYVEGGGLKEKQRGQGYFTLAKRGTIVFFWYKDKGGSYDSARFIRSQFKKVTLVNQLDRMEYKDI